MFLLPSEKAPLAGAGLEIDFQSETEVVAPDGQKTRHEEPNYRVYQFAGTAHIRNIDVVEFGLPDPEKANPAEWYAVLPGALRCRQQLVRRNRAAADHLAWRSATIRRSSAMSKGMLWSALSEDSPWTLPPTGCRKSPSARTSTSHYDPTYEDGSFLGFFRAIGGGHVDLTGSFTNHDDYVRQIAYHARGLQAGGYLLEADADAIIQRAIQSDIVADGRPRVATRGFQLRLQS